MAMGLACSAEAWASVGLPDEEPRSGVDRREAVDVCEVIEALCAACNAGEGRVKLVRYQEEHRCWEVSVAPPSWWVLVIMMLCCTLGVAM